MGQLVIIGGRSGTGKSTSLRNMNPADTLLIKVVDKPLPFPEKKFGWKKLDTSTGEGNVIVTDNADMMIALMKKAPEKGFKNIVIDDGTFEMVNSMMRRASEKGYEKWTELAFDVWRMVNVVRELPDDVIVWLIWHVETDQFGNTKLRTVGKLTDEKIDIPALATIVLLADRVDGKYVFRTQNTGTDIAKSPIGLFDEELIENDLKKVEETIRRYYEGE